jgi:sugar/nucleoside kinase (ribokinase family)
MPAKNIDVCTVGHFALDSIVVPTRDKAFHNLGGATTYTSFAVKTLEAKASVISRVGGDFPEAYLWWLHEEGIDVSAVKRVPEETTTNFELTYNKDFSERTLKLTGRGYPINIDDIPKDFHAKAIHIAPIANEITIETVERLKACCDVLSVDPQGFLRSFDENGNVTQSLQADKRILSFINIYKSSQDEIFALTGKSELKPAIKAVHNLGVGTVIVTMGAKGSLLSVEGAHYTVPACKSAVLVDPTGAGDVFIGAFLTQYLLQKESLWCAAVGSAAASMVVEGIGSTYFGEKQEILKRAKELYEKELKQ